MRLYHNIFHDTFGKESDGYFQEKDVSLQVKRHKA